MLKIHGLKKRFGNFQALNGLEMEIEVGRFTVLSVRTEPERRRRSAL